MIHCVGWKRLEANRMFTLEEVETRNFNAILRRALVWRVKARFEDPHLLQSTYADIDKDGVFPKDPDLSRFLQIQHGFESKYGKQECLDMIENYVTWGGDGGLTEAVMRKACKLPPRNVRSAATRAGGVICVEEGEEEEQEPQKWTNLRRGLIDFVLLRRKLFISASLLKGFVCKDGPNISRDGILDGLIQMSYLQTCPGEGKAKTLYLPVLTPKVDLGLICKFQERECGGTLPEVYNVAALSKYLHEYLNRRENAEVLAEAWKAAGKAKRGAGRVAADALKARTEMQERGDKLLQGEKDADSLLEKCNGPPAKRLKGKQEVKAEDDQEQRCKDMGKQQCSYHYSGPSTRARKQVSGVGAQKFSRRIQAILLTNTYDLDIENSLFTLIWQLLAKLDLEPPMPQEARDALQACFENRSGVCTEKLQVSLGEGKRLLVSTFYGAAIPKKHQQKDFMHDLQKAANYCKWTATSCLRDVYKSFLEDGSKKNPEASVLAHLYFICEDVVLSARAQFLQETFNPEHLSLHYDGVRVSSISGVSVADLCQRSEAHIAEKTGFHVRIREKKHRTVLEMVKEFATSTQAPRFYHGHTYCQVGNCIPHSLACLGVLEEEHESLLKNDAAVENVYMQQRQCRTYNQCASMFNCSLIPVLWQDGGIPNGKCLMHVENMGRPHCCAISKTNETVTVWDFDCIMEVSNALFEAAVQDGIDSSTCVFFTLDGGKEEDFEAADEHLLDLAAGGELEELPILIDETDDEILSSRTCKDKPMEQELQRLDPDGLVTVEHALLKELEGEIAKYQDQAEALVSKKYLPMPCMSISKLPAV